MRIFNVLYKYNGNQVKKQYYVKNMEELMREVNKDKKVLTKGKCIAEIYDIKKNWRGEI